MYFEMKNETFNVVAWNNEYARRYILSTVLQSLYLVLGVCGNLTAIIIYSTKMHSKHDDRYFIPFLASVDLAGCLVSTTFALIKNNLPYKFPNTAICKMLNFFTSVLIIASIFLLLVISVQRYQKICRPFGFQMDLRCKQIVASLVFFFAATLAFPSIFLYEKIEVVHLSTNVTGHRCGPVQNTEAFGAIYRGVVITAEFISIVCTSVSYGFVGHTLIKKLKSRKINKNATTISDTACNHTECQRVERVDIGLRGNPKHKKENFRTGKQYSLMFLIIFIVSIICFFPPWTFVLLETTDKTFWNNLSYDETQLFIILREVFVLNFVINPFIYCFFDSAFRHHVCKWLPCKRWKTQSDRI